MNILQLEKELKKRLDFPYVWGRKQTNNFDSATNFIYKTNSFKALLAQIDANFKNQDNYVDLKNYALNRWFNFWSAKAIEAFFCEHEHVTAHKNSKDKYTDFYISNIPFDHKTTVFPKGFNKSLPYAIEHTQELIEWFYKNQSKQKRYHLKNRLFLVVLDFNNPKDSWKLKSEILWLQNIVSTYLSTFDAQNLESFYFQNQLIKSDVIWAIK
ncbi:hypothetical protein MKD41_12820 [Lutibacter sp. A64]|uniref:hypothetical protein n=1 Tax=Lutibacter sp. A64 TaxID=2918526 RepID=UPI001F0696FA|nr:hypothetical protein [Lutibacter sp. A64]UMB53211.1 hypothetical protein MKD41_12820 [Lutibacter sp. A64]